MKTSELSYGLHFALLIDIRKVNSFMTEAVIMERFLYDNCLRHERVKVIVLVS